MRKIIKNIRKLNLDELKRQKSKSKSMDFDGKLFVISNNTKKYSKLKKYKEVKVLSFKYLDKLNKELRKLTLKVIYSDNEKIIEKINTNEGILVFVLPKNKIKNAKLKNLVVSSKLKGFELAQTVFHVILFLFSNPGLCNLYLEDLILLLRNNKKIYTEHLTIKNYRKLKENKNLKKFLKVKKKFKKILVLVIGDKEIILGNYNEFCEYLGERLLKPNGDFLGNIKIMNDMPKNTMEAFIFTIE